LSARTKTAATSVSRATTTPTSNKTASAAKPRTRNNHGRH
jgi:hypothetical protein